MLQIGTCPGQATEILDAFDYVVDDLSMIKEKELQKFGSNELFAWVPRKLRMMSCKKKRKNTCEIFYFFEQGGREYIIEPLRELQPNFKVLSEFASEYKK